MSLSIEGTVGLNLPSMWRRRREVFPVFPFPTRIALANGIVGEVGGLGVLVLDFLLPMGLVCVVGSGWGGCLVEGMGGLEGWFLSCDWKFRYLAF
mgnify:CR=1 FL=1